MTEIENDDHHCAICGFPLDLPLRFPKDFPPQFKFCCDCHMIVEYLLFPTEEAIKHVGGCYICQRIIKEYKEKILKTITLM